MSLRHILSAVGLCLALGAAAQQVGIVHDQLIIRELPGYQQAQDQIVATSQSYNDELTILRNEIDKKFAEYQQLDPKTDTAIFLRRQQELQELDQKYQQFYAEAAKEMERKRNELMGNLQTTIDNAIRTIGQRDNYLIIFTDSNAPAYLGADVVDLTDAVRLLLLLNR